MGPHLLRIERGRRGLLARTLAARSKSEPRFPGPGPGLRRRARRTLSYGARSHRRRRRLLGGSTKPHARTRARREDRERRPNPRPPLPRRRFRDDRRKPLAALLPLAQDHPHPGRRPSLPRTRRPPARPLQLHTRPPLLLRRKTTARKQLLPRRRNAQAPLRQTSHHNALCNGLGDAGSRRTLNKKIRRREASMGSRRQKTRPLKARPKRADEARSAVPTSEDVSPSVPTSCRRQRAKRPVGRVRSGGA
jgi:hypothetical protein